MATWAAVGTKVTLSFANPSKFGIWRWAGSASSSVFSKVSTNLPIKLASIYRWAGQTLMLQFDKLPAASDVKVGVSFGNNKVGTLQAGNKNSISWS